MPILEYKRNGKTQNDLELHNNRSSASIDDNTTSTDKTWSSKKIDEHLNNIANQLEDLVITGGGLSSNAKTLLMTILQNAIYTTDQSANIIALQNALASSESGEGDTPTTTYTITNTLTNVANSNSAITVEENSSYTATLTVDDGYTLDTPTITMGGTDVTSTVYADGTITIDAVTGDVVIVATATAENTQPTLLYQLPEETTFDGTNYLDTETSVYGISSYSVMIDFTSTNNSNTRYMFCCYENDSNICGLHNNYDADIRIDGKIGDSWLSTLRIWGSSDTSLTSNKKLVITHNANEKVKLHYINASGVQTTTEYSATNLFDTINSNFILGSQKKDTTATTKFIGTIHDFKVYNGIISDSEITGYLEVA